MSWLSDYLRRRRIDPAHQTRRHFARQIAKHGFEIGDYTYGKPAVHFDRSNPAKIVIGNFCSIGEGVEFFLSVDHRSKWITTFPFNGAAGWGAHSQEQFTSKGNITVGSDVWIGAGAAIMSGVTIGHGAIIGARSVVTKDVAPYAIAAGNPAQLVKLRFQDHEIKKLLAFAWWDLPKEEIRSLIPFLQSGNVALLAHAKTSTSETRQMPLLSDSVV